MRNSNALLRTILLAVPALLVAAGCSVIAGVSFGDAHEATSGGSGGEGGTDPGQLDEDGSVVDTPDATPTGCAADQKMCGGACVSTKDPAYGCEASDCLPCSVSFANSATCKAGQCAAGSCSPDHGDCDNDPKNGCEASLSSPTSCRACGVVCPGTAPLCSATGCVSSCPTNTTQCGSACVDMTMDRDNCGICGRKCVAPANGDPTCTTGTCGFSCRSGFSDCVNNPATACNALPKWYADTDGDGVGSAVSVQACAPPAGYVAASGDCLDSNAQVHPGQTAFFGTAFTDTLGNPSFDYDCSGVEVDNAEHWPGVCDVDCIGFGYVPAAARPGAGVNAYCGSVSTRVCIDTGGTSGKLPAQSLRSPSIAQGCSPRVQSSSANGCH